MSMPMPPNASRVCTCMPRRLFALHIARIPIEHGLGVTALASGLVFLVLTLGLRLDWLPFRHGGSDEDIRAVLRYVLTRGSRPGVAVRALRGLGSVRFGVEMPPARVRL